VVEIHLRPNVVLVRAFLVQDLPEQVAELIRGVEQNLVAILLGKREPQVRPPLKGPVKTFVSPGAK